MRTGVSGGRSGPCGAKLGVLTQSQHDRQQPVDEQGAEGGCKPYEVETCGRPLAALHHPGPVLARSTVEHEPWPLHRATVRELDSNLVTAAGLPAPEGEPLVHWSPGVRTRISALRPLGRT